MTEKRRYTLSFYFAAQEIRGGYDARELCVRAAPVFAFISPDGPVDVYQTTLLADTFGIHRPILPDRHRDALERIVEITNWGDRFEDEGRTSNEAECNRLARQILGMEPEKVERG